MNDTLALWPFYSGANSSRCQFDGVLEGLRRKILFFTRITQCVIKFVYALNMCAVHYHVI